MTKGQTRNLALRKPGQSTFSTVHLHNIENNIDGHHVRHDPSKRMPKSLERITYAFLCSGIISFIASILSSSFILAFIGLGLTFWGTLFLFLRSVKYMRADILGSTVLSSIKAISQIITELRYKGMAIYLPPKYLKDLKGGTVFIPSERELIVPPTGELVKETIFRKNPHGMYLTPPGLGLVNLFENELGTEFTRVDLNYLLTNLPRLLIEDLEMVEGFELDTEDGMIKVKIMESIYRDLCREVKKLSNSSNSIGCPLCSAVAIAITRVTGKPVTLEKTEVPEDDKTIEVHYRIVEE